MNTKLVKIEDLKIPEYIKRHHSKSQIDKCISSLTRYDQYQPIVVSGNEILCGVLVFIALKKMGKTEIWVNDLGELPLEKKKEIRYLELDDHYNRNLSISENLKNLQDQGYQICIKSLYNYCKERGITVDQAKLSDDDLRDLINPEISYRKNAEQIRQLGFKVRDKRLKLLLKEMRPICKSL